MSLGIIYNLVTKILFIGGAYIIHIYVARKLGPGQYGTFGVVLSILTILYIFIVNGAKQTISKYTAIYSESSKYIFMIGLQIQCVVAFILALIVTGGAGYMSIFFNDPDLKSPLRVAGLIVLAQGLMALCIGTLNGQKRFFFENMVQCIYGTVRPVAAIFFVYIGMGVMGVVLGFLTAASFAAVTGCAIVLLSFQNNTPCIIRWADLLTPVLLNIIIFASITALMNIDVLFVKNMVPDKSTTGFYTAASAFAKPFYWLLVSFGTVALPLVSKSYSEKDMKQCRRYLSQLLRYSVIIFLPILVIMAGTSDALMAFLYSSIYEKAAPVFQILGFGIFLIGIFNIFAHVVIAIGMEWYVAILSICAIAIDIILNLFLIPQYGMTGAALATLLSAGGLCMAAGGIAIYKIGIDVTAISMVRLGGLLITLFYFSGSVYMSQMIIPIKYCILYMGYIAALFVTREINADDINVIRNLLNKRLNKDLSSKQGA